MTTEAEPLAPAPHFAPSGRIIRRDDLIVVDEADALMRATHQRVGSIQEAARARFEAEIESGRAEGRRQGMVEKAELVAETAAKAHQALDGLEAEIAAIAADVVERMVGEIDDRDLALRLARQAVQKLRDEKKVTIYVAPELASPLEKDLGRYLRSLGRADLVKVEGDERLGRRDCVMASEVGWVDLGLEAQLKALRDGLTRAQAAVADA